MQVLNIPAMGCGIWYLYRSGRKLWPQGIRPWMLWVLALAVQLKSNYSIVMVALVILCLVMAADRRRWQYAALAGLMEAKDLADITISIDCGGQDDINAMDRMVEAYAQGAEMVYGVRSRRDTDTFFKRFTAEGFYHLMHWMGAEVVFNHADYRLISSRVLQEFANFKEVNLFLRGLIPLVGFHSTSVYYERHERLAGESHYPLRKMLALAFDGITSLSVKPIRMITALGCIVSVLGFLAVIWAIVMAVTGQTIAGWASSLHYLLPGGHLASEPGGHRRVYRQDLSGDQAPAPVYHQ